MSFPCTELLLFNYAKVNTVFHSMTPLADAFIQSDLQLTLYHYKTYETMFVKSSYNSSLWEKHS